MARTVEGFEELRRNLEALQTQAARNALQLATRKAAQVVRDEAQMRAPERQDNRIKQTYKGNPQGPGYLKRHINVAVKYYRNTGIVRAVIGPSAEAFYGTQFIEVGTSRIPRKPWLVPAYTAKIGQVEATFVHELRAAIERAVKRGKVR